MPELLENFAKAQIKTKLPEVRSGDTVRVHQRIREGSKERVQMFEGVVIRTRRANSLTAQITVRRLASGVGVEKSFMLNAPNVEQVEIVRRSKVRRNYLSYLRQRQGKSARLREVDFDKVLANASDAATADDIAIAAVEEETTVAAATAADSASDESDGDDASAEETTPSTKS